MISLSFRSVLFLFFVRFCVTYKPFRIASDFVYIQLFAISNSDPLRILRVQNVLSVIRIVTAACCLFFFSFLLQFWPGRERECRNLFTCDSFFTIPLSISTTVDRTRTFARPCLNAFHEWITRTFGPEVIFLLFIWFFFTRSLILLPVCMYVYLSLARRHLTEIAMLEADGHLTFSLLLSLFGHSTFLLSVSLVPSKHCHHLIVIKIVLEYFVHTVTLDTFIYTSNPCAPQFYQFGQHCVTPVPLPFRFMFCCATWIQNDTRVLMVDNFSAHSTRFGSSFIHLLACLPYTYSFC